MSSRGDAKLEDYLSPRQSQELLARLGAGGREPFIAQLYKDLYRGILQLEKSAEKHQDSNEELLTYILCLWLRGSGYTAATEANQRGHCDLSVELNDPPLTWLAEAKIHGGYTYDEEGLKQLLTRYSSGRDPAMAAIFYVKQQKTEPIVTKWKGHLLKTKSCDFRELQETHPALNDDRAKKYSFVSTHEHQVSGSEVAVHHFMVALGYAPKDKSALGTVK